MFDVEQHGFKIDRGGGRFTKTIKNWAGFKRNGIWSESQGRLEAASDPSDLDGFVYGEQSAKAPLQLYLKNGDDAKNATRVHGRYSDDPGSWFEVAANKGGLGFVDGVAAIITRNERRARFNQLWSTGAGNGRKSSLNWFTLRHRLRKVIRINGPQALTSYQFRLRLPVDWSFEIAANGDGMIKNGAGVARFRMPAPYAWDSADGGDVQGPSIDGPRYAAEFVIDQALTVGGHPVYLFSVAVTDSIASATFPVWLHPDTTIISGTAAIEDALLFKGGNHLNYGSLTGNGASIGDSALPSQTARGLVRILSPGTNIPAGTITAVRWEHTRNSNPNSFNIGTMEAYTVASAFSDWVEGTGTGQLQVGSCDWVDRVHGTSAWSTPGGAVGTDFDSGNIGTLAYAAYSAGPPVAGTFTFSDVTDFSAWRDGDKANGGMLFKEAVDGVGANDYYTTESTEGINPPSFEIDFTPPAAGHRAINRAIARSIGRGGSF